MPRSNRTGEDRVIEVLNKADLLGGTASVRAARTGRRARSPR